MVCFNGRASISRWIQPKLIGRYVEFVVAERYHFLLFKKSSELKLIPVCAFSLFYYTILIITGVMSIKIELS